MDEDVNGQVQGNSGLGIMAEALCEAIMHHAEIYSCENVAPSDVAALELEIADLTSSYHDMSKKRTGVDIEFKQGPLLDSSSYMNALARTRRTARQELAKKNCLRMKRYT